MKLSFTCTVLSDLRGDCVILEGDRSQGDRENLKATLLLLQRSFTDLSFADLIVRQDPSSLQRESFKDFYVCFLSCIHLA